MGAGFGEKVKRNVTRNFDHSCRQYRWFEERYGFFTSLALQLAEQIGLRPGSEVLDVGCGNGVSARALNRHFNCRVLGVDLSPAMVADGMSAVASENIRLIVGDGERLGEIVAGRRFDYVLYNASLFIFPDVETALRQAATCLRPNGKIAFSYYPRLVAGSGADLIDTAFSRLQATPPRSRVITSFATAAAALAGCCRQVRRHEWRHPLDLDFIKDFFTIPAQSASLFPGHPYIERRGQVQRLFDAVRDLADDTTVIWRMAEGADPIRRRP
jgi:ubiquinone/menaquinone biosynthesis C-methylase UbiE